MHNLGWRNHLNFSWSNQGQLIQNLLLGFQQQPSFQEKKSIQEDPMTKYINMLETCMQIMETSLRNQYASIHNLEIQIGQIEKLISEKPQWKLFGNTEINPREKVNLIIWRSGKELPRGQENKKMAEIADETHMKSVAKGHGELEEMSRREY